MHKQRDVQNGLMQSKWDFRKTILLLAENSSKGSFRKFPELFTSGNAWTGTGFGIGCSEGCLYYWDRSGTSTECYKQISEWNATYFTRKAMTVGPNTVKVIEHILRSREHEVQIYCLCIGILGYTKKYSKQALEDCCKLAIDTNHISYSFIKNSLTALLLRKSGVAVLIRNSMKNVTKALLSWARMPEKFVRMLYLKHTYYLYIHDKLGIRIILVRVYEYKNSTGYSAKIKWKLKAVCIEAWVILPCNRRTETILCRRCATSYSGKNLFRVSMVSFAV